VKHRQDRLKEFFNDLDKAGTPIPIVQAIRHGFSHWLQDPASIDIRSLTAGSLQAPDAVLTTAFNEQVRHNGWYHLCLGRVSKKWSLAVQQYDRSFSRDSGLHWTSLFIAALWRYSKMLWRFRNEVVHGSTVAVQVTLQLNKLKEKITEYYQAYSVTPSIVLDRHQYLFITHTVAERISGSYDSMAAWIHSVEEAILVLRYHEEANRAASTAFFPSQQATAHEDSEDDSTYSATNLSTDSSLSLAPTDSTTATTNTKSTGSSSSIVIVGRIYPGTSDSSSLGTSTKDDISISTIGSSFSHSSSTSASDVESSSVASLSLGDVCNSADEVETVAYSITAYTSPNSYQSPRYSIRNINQKQEISDISFTQHSLALSDTSTINRVGLPSGNLATQNSDFPSTENMSSGDVELSSVASLDTIISGIDVRTASGSVDVEFCSVASADTRSGGSVSSSDSLINPVFAGR
jgi:hypothetical protein